MDIRITIDNLLTGVKSDFDNNLTNLNENERLCEKLDFSNFSQGDYSNLLKQQYYILRYMYAYSYEYMRMYIDILNKYVTDDRSSISQKTLKIASIGCGNMADYYSLRKVVTAQKKDGCTFLPNEEQFNTFYTGYDIVNWSEQYRFDNDYAKFKLGDITTKLNSTDFDANTDIICFPKSIGELSEDVVRTISNYIFSISKKTKLVFGISYSSEADSNIRPGKKDVIIAEACNNKFSCTYDSGLNTNESLGLTYVDKEGKTQALPICCCPDILESYKYPNAIYNFISNIKTKCSDCINDTCPCSSTKWNSCERKLRHPVVKTSNINYEVLVFEKRKES